MTTAHPDAAGESGRREVQEMPARARLSIRTEPARATTRLGRGLAALPQAKKQRKRQRFCPLFQLTGYTGRSWPGHSLFERGMRPM